MFKRALIVLVATSVTLVGFPAPSGAEAGGGQFQCTVSFAGWPGGSGATECNGVARGVFREGATTLVCAPFCEFSMEILYSSTCVGSSPFHADFSGDMTVSSLAGTFQTPYSGALVELTFTFTTSSPLGAGGAVFLPAPTIPTCGGPQGTLNAEMHGAVAFD